MEKRRGHRALRRWAVTSAALACGLIGMAASPGSAASAATPAFAASPATHVVTEVGAPPTDWDPAAAQAAVLSGPVSAVPGSPARMDEPAVAAALAGTNMRVLGLPLEPVDRAAAGEAGQQRIDLEGWARDEHDIELIVIQGYEVHVSIFTISPDTLPEMERILAHGDVTAQVLFAIDYLKRDERPENGPPVPAAPRAPADPRQVDDIAAAMRADGVYVAPEVYAGAGETTWTAGDGLAVRGAFLPVAGDDDVLPDLLTPLQQRFPDDVVVVVHGRFLEASGPEAAADVVRGSVLWTFGTYAGPLLSWNMAMPRVVSAFAERMALLRTGVVSDQSPPSDPADVVGNARAALPWVFGAVAVLIAAAVAARPLLGRGRLAREHAVTAGLEETRTRRRLSLELVELSRQLLGIEPLAVDGPARKQVDAALERYRVARETLGRDGDIRVVEDALAGARAALRAATKSLGVPPAGEDTRSTPGGRHG